MDRRHDGLRLDARPDVEASWSQLYVYLHQRLGTYQPFRAWLDALLAGAAVRPGTQQLQRWREGSLGRHLLTASPQESIGLIVAVGLPGRGTFRFAFPLPQDFHRYLTLLGNQHGRTATAVPEQDVLRHILTQMNFSCGEPWGVLDGQALVRESMMWAAFVSNHALYCGDVFDLDTDGGTIYAIPGTDVRFRSVDVEAQRSWSLSSIIYVPCRYDDDDGRPQGFTLALYSPLPDLFPGFLNTTSVNTSPELRRLNSSHTGGREPSPLLAAGPPPSWVKWLTTEIIPPAWYRALVQQDEVARYASRASLACQDEVVYQRIERAPDKLRELISPLQVSTAELDAVLRGFRDFLFDPHLLNLQFLSSGLRELADARAESIDSDLVLQILRYVAILDYNRSGSRMDRVAFPRVDPLQDLEPTRALLKSTTDLLDRHPLAKWAARFLNALVKNAVDYGNLRRGPAEVVAASAARSWVLTVSNWVEFDALLLRRYWTVREGILPVGTPSFGLHSGLEDRMGHGVQLFLLRHLPHETHLRIDFLLDPPKAGSSLARWHSRLRVGA